MCPKVRIGQAGILCWEQLFKLLQLFPPCLLPPFLSSQIRVSDACKKKNKNQSTQGIIMHRDRAAINLADLKVPEGNTSSVS